RADDLHELLGLDGDAALALDVRVAPGRQRDVEIGRGQVELVLAGGQQQVREDGDGRLALDDSLHRAKLTQELTAIEADLHSLLRLEEGIYSIPRRSRNRRCGICGKPQKWLNGRSLPIRNRDVRKLRMACGTCGGICAGGRSSALSSTPP